LSPADAELFGTTLALAQQPTLRLDEQLAVFGSTSRQWLLLVVLVRGVCPGTRRRGRSRRRRSGRRGRTSRGSLGSSSEVAAGGGRRSFLTTMAEIDPVQGGLS
jgi:hypothetical protein